MLIVLLLALSLVAGVLGGVIGTGSSLILLPLLVLLDGPRTAVPIMGLAAVLANVGRLIAWWRVVRWRLVLAYAVPAVPAAAIGARTLLALPVRLVDLVLAAFFLGMIPLRRVAEHRRLRFRWWQVSIAGLVIGFLTGVVLSTGPMSVLVFAGSGLTGGAFLGTESAAALLTYAGKLASFGTAGALDGDVVPLGLAIGACLLLGALVARRLVERIPQRWSGLLIDAVLAVGAVGLAVAAFD